MKRKTQIPLITHPKQKVTVSEGKTALASWEGDSSSSGLNRNKLRFMRWLEKHRNTARMKRLSISDVCEIAEHHGIKIPANIHRNSTARIAGAEGAEGHVGQVHAGTLMDINQELQEEILQKDAEISRLKTENEKLTKANNKIFGHRGDWGKEI